MTKLALADLCESAARIMQRRGHTVRTRLDAFGRVCALGALDLVGHDNVIEQKYHTEVAEAMVRILELPSDGPQYAAGAPGYVADWNNVTDQKTVVAGFLRTAAILREEAEFDALIAEQAAKCDAEVEAVRA